MPRRPLICWLALVGVVSGAALRAAEDRARAATAIVEALAAGRFAAVFERFDPTMRKALPAVAPTSSRPARGKTTPAEYELPGNVAATVIADIAAWILGGTLP